MRVESYRPGEGLHVAVIMDGNGRWAQARKLRRTAGHKEGAKAVRRTVEAAVELGIDTLTLYAFSADNWKRPREEVSALMQLLEIYIGKETERCIENGVRMMVIGRRDRLSPRIVRAIERAEARTAGGRKLDLRIAIDYSAREAIARAAASQANSKDHSPQHFAYLLNRAIHSDPASPDVDLLIRTSGEQRLSDFLLWECAYAELLFTPRLWPDFDKQDLLAALEEFHNRDRRFGEVVELAS
ncbi:MAG: di-trans,poly-cis-decaprenylcistransferase [Acidobacteriota bacterium]